MNAHYPLDADHPDFDTVAELLADRRYDARMRRNDRLDDGDPEKLEPED